MKRFLQGFVVALVLVVIAALVVVFSGRYDVAASSSNVAVVDWLLEVTRERSIDARATATAVPASEQANAHAGFAEYNETCVMCHGAPSHEPRPFAKGLNPAPPGYAEIGRLPRSKLFWVVKHGIKMTAMPAFGPSHGDAKIADIVAFVQQLPSMTAATYDAFGRSAAPDTPAAKPAPAAAEDATTADAPAPGAPVPAPGTSQPQ